MRHCHHIFNHKDHSTWLVCSYDRVWSKGCWMEGCSSSNLSLYLHWTSISYFFVTSILHGSMPVLTRYFSKLSGGYGGSVVGLDDCRSNEVPVIKHHFIDPSFWRQHFFGTSLGKKYCMLFELMTLVGSWYWHVFLCKPYHIGCSNDLVGWIQRVIHGKDDFKSNVTWIGYQAPFYDTLYLHGSLYAEAIHFPRLTRRHRYYLEYLRYNQLAKVSSFSNGYSKAQSWSQLNTCCPHSLCSSTAIDCLYDSYTQTSSHDVDLTCS